MALSSSFAISSNNPAWHHTHNTLQFNTFRTPSLELHTLPILRNARSFRIRCTALDPFGNTVAPLEHPAFDDPSSKPETGGGDGDEGFGALLNFEAVMEEAKARGVELPPDMVEAAKITGIREVFFHRYMQLQGSARPVSFLMRHCPMLRNRMLADPSFQFKVVAEIILDAICPTAAEARQRGSAFLNEFELFVADLLVGSFQDIFVVAMLAPSARIGKPSSFSSSSSSTSRGLLGRIQRTWLNVNPIVDMMLLNYCLNAVYSKLKG